MPYVPYGGPTQEELNTVYSPPPQPEAQKPGLVEDLVNTVSNWYEGKKADQAEIERAKASGDPNWIAAAQDAERNNSPILNTLNPANMVYSLQENAGFTPSNALEQNYEAPQTQEPTISSAPSNTERALQIAEAPVKTAYELTLKPAVDIGTDVVGSAIGGRQSNLSKMWDEHPAAALANVGMAALPIIPFAKGVRSGIRSVPELKNELINTVEAKLNPQLDELTNITPVKAVDGLDALDQYDSPTRGFRPATADEMEQWNTDQRYGPLFDQEPQARFGSDTSLSELPRTNQGETVTPLVSILKKVNQDKWDTATGDSWQNHLNTAADNAMLSPAERVMSGAEIPEKTPFSSNQGFVLGEKPQTNEIYVPEQFRRQAESQAVQQPFKLPTADDLVSDTENRYLNSQLQKAVNNRDYPTVEKISSRMQQSGYETPLSRAVVNRNIEFSKTSAPLSDVSITARQLADTVENQLRPQSPNTENMATDMLNKAYNAYLNKDYDTAFEYAKQTGDKGVEQIFRQLRDTEGGEVPLQPRFEGKPEGKYTGQNITKRTLMQRVGDLFVPTRTGRIGRRDVNGFMNHQTGIIRTRNYGDLNAVAHEVGHSVDAALGLRKYAGAFDNEFSQAVRNRFPEGAYEPEQVRAEGIAEFMRDYVTNPGRAQQTFPRYYSAFEDALSRNADVQSRVNEFRDMVRTWQEQSPEARGRSSVSYSYEQKPDIIQRGKDGWLKTQEYWLDDKVGLARVTSEYERITGEKLATENDPYKMARLAQNSAVARADLLIDGKNPEFVKQALNKSYGGSIDSAVTMRSVLQHLDGLSKKYPEYLKQGNFKDWHEALDTLLVARRQVELQDIYPEYMGSISKSDVEAIIRNAPRELNDITKECYKYNDNILRIIAHEGLIKPEIYDILTTKYHNYVPMIRDFSDTSAVERGFGIGTGYANVRNALKPIDEHGSPLPVVSPLESMVKNTYAMLNLVERNNVGKIFARLAQHDRVGKLVEGDIHGTAKTNDSTFSVWVNGEKKVYQTSPDIYRAIMSLNKDSANAITKLLAPPASMLRAGATLTPDFALKNIIRDTFSAAVFSRYGFIPVVDHAAGIFHMLKKDQLYYEYKASGALQSTLVGLDRDYTQASIRGLYKKNARYFWSNYNPVQILRGFSEALETATRLGEYTKARGKGVSIADAALSARDVTLDFSKHGVYGKTANKIVAFFNAAVQEPARIVQAFKENPTGTAAKIGLYITTPSVVLWAMNHDQDWYKELPSYQKNLFWVFKSGDTVYRIPKPFGLGVLFGSGAERMLDWAYGKDQKGMSRWAGDFLEAMSPNILPTAIAPLLEWQANYSFFTGRNIVPQREEKLPNKMQYGPDTSGLAKYVGERFDLSPRKVDSLMQGYGAGMARQSLNLADAVRGDRPLKNPYSTAFTVDPYKSPQSIQDFYEELNKAEQNYNASKVNKTSFTGTDKNNYTKLNGANKMMQQLNKLEREALQSTKLDADQKASKVSDINKKQAQLAQAALKQLKR